MGSINKSKAVILFSAAYRKISFQDREQNTYESFFISNPQDYTKKCCLTIWTDGANICFDHCPSAPVSSQTCAPGSASCKLLVDMTSGASDNFADIWLTDDQVVIGIGDMRDGITNSIGIEIPADKDRLVIEFNNDKQIWIHHPYGTRQDLTTNFNTTASECSPH